MKIKCKLCDKEFKAYRFLFLHLTNSHPSINHEEYFKLFIKDKFDILCPFCGEEKKLKSFSSGYRPTCGKTECIVKLRQQTSLEKYGKSSFTQTQAYLKKTEETCLKKYGVSHFLNSTEIKEKRTKSNLEKYGIENVFQSEEVKQKSKITKKEKYGDENYHNHKKAQITHLEKYGRKFGQFTEEQRRKGDLVKRKKLYAEFFNNIKYDEVTPLFSLEEYKGVYIDHSWKCNKCGEIFEDKLNNQKTPRCPICYPKTVGTSFGEKEVASYIAEYCEIKTNIRFYSEGKSFKELDIFIPELNLGIEFNGVKHHSDYFGEKDKYYHIGKTNFFKDKNINVIHILDCEWDNKKDIVKSILLNKIGKTPYKIFARKCEIRKVNHSEATQFLDNNHLQGKCISSQHYGLYFNNELVCLLSISKSRFSKKYEWEITRFCNKNYYSIVGGFSKLLKHFIKNHNPNNIVTYADKRFSLGGLYLKNDFKYLQDTPPNYYYFYNTKDYVLFNRIAFQKHKLEKKLKTFSPERTEWDNMMDNGYDRIWDCGNMVFEWKKEG